MARERLARGGDARRSIIDAAKSSLVAESEERKAIALGGDPFAMATESAVAGLRPRQEERLAELGMTFGQRIAAAARRANGEPETAPPATPTPSAAERAEAGTDDERRARAAELLDSLPIEDALALEAELDERAAARIIAGSEGLDDDGEADDDEEAEDE